MQLTFFSFGAVAILVFVASASVLEAASVLTSGLAAFVLLGRCGGASAAHFFADFPSLLFVTVFFAMFVAPSKFAPTSQYANPAEVMVDDTLVQFSLEMASRRSRNRKRGEIKSARTGDKMRELVAHRLPD